MPAIADQLRNYAEAMSDPTRAMILIELDRAGELTATQLARRLDLTANNVYHHTRILLNLGVIDPPRIVPGDTYVEKYYHINPEIHAALRLDPQWYGRARETMSVEDRQSVVVSACLAMAHLLRRRAQEYLEMDPADLDRHMREDHRILLSMTRLNGEELQDRLEAIRKALDGGDAKWAEDLGPRSDVLLIAGLPFFGSSEDGE